VVEGCGTHNEAPDAFLLVMCARDVRRAAEMARKHVATDAARGQLGEALDDFDRALPGVENARDVLEHFDEYTRGAGDLQQPGERRPRTPGEELALCYQIGFEHIDNDPARPNWSLGLAQSTSWQRRRRAS
jgi:hypothetical protein